MIIKPIVWGIEIYYQQSSNRAIKKAILSHHSNDNDNQTYCMRLELAILTGQVLGFHQGVWDIKWWDDLIFMPETSNLMKWFKKIVQLVKSKTSNWQVEESYSLLPGNAGNFSRHPSARRSWRSQARGIRGPHLKYDTVVKTSQGIHEKPLKSHEITPLLH